MRLEQEMESKVILDDVNAVFKPSTTTLVLGPPGSGKVRKRHQCGTRMCMNTASFACFTNLW